MHVHAQTGTFINTHVNTLSYKHPIYLLRIDTHSYINA